MFASAGLGGLCRGTSSLACSCHAITGLFAARMLINLPRRFESASRSSSANRPLRSPSLRVVTAASAPPVWNAATAPSQLPTAPEPDTFQSLGLGPEVLAALEDQGIKEPTEVQALSIPAVLAGKGDYMLASHTGSGKTLAYLLPIVEALKAEEKAGFVPRPKRPRVVVLGPTKELTEQIAGVAKALCHTVKFRVALMGSGGGGRNRAQQAEKLAGPVDVVVATPTKLLQHVADGSLFYRDVRWLVIDEADTMFAEGWGTEIGEILRPLRSKPEPSRVILVSATLTKPIKRLLATTFPDINTLQTKSTHRAIVGSRHGFMSLPPGRDKLDVLSEILGADSKRKQKTLVFCNSVDSCRAVEHYCREHDLPTVCYHGEMPVSARQESMRTFAGAVSEGATSGASVGSEDGEDSHASTSGSSKAKVTMPVMIATDIAARGLDFPGQVDHVVNFDFPYTAVDYIHRAGRTARAGRTGRVTSVVTKRDKTLAQRIEWALGHGEELDQLSADPNILPPSQRPAPGTGRGGGRASSPARGGGRGSSEGQGGRGGRGSGRGGLGASRSSGPAGGRGGAAAGRRAGGPSERRGGPAGGRGGGRSSGGRGRGGGR